MSTNEAAERLRDLEAQFNADAKKWLKEGSGMTNQQETGAAMVWSWLTAAERSAGAVPDIFEQCSVCGGANRVTLLPDWREPLRAIPIVGCGNPWHYTNVAGRSAEDDV